MFFEDQKKKEDELGRETSEYIPAVRFAQMIDADKYNLPKYAAKSEYLTYFTLEKDDTSIDIAKKLAEVHAKNNSFGNEKINVNHFFIDLRLLKLNLKLDSIRRKKNLDEFSELEVASIMQDLNLMTYTEIGK